MINEENAKRVVEILNDMEKNGEFDELTKDEREIERQVLGMRIGREIEE